MNVVAPLETQMASSPILNDIAGLDSTLSLGLAPSSIGADNISRIIAPQSPTAYDPAQPLEQSVEYGANEMMNPMGSMMAQLMQMMQTLMSSLGLGSQYGSGYGGYGSPYGSGYASPYGSGNGSTYGSGYGGYGGYGCPQYGNEQYYSSATGGSQGDPHLSFNGNTWDNMTSQPNLLQSNSFPGGYQISTQVSAPNAKGVTYNQSATISMNGGATTVGLSNNGQPCIQEYGQNVPISPGQTVQLGSGEEVTCNQNGSLTVQAQNGNGGQITTTLTATGPGVNVNVNAQNVDLGGSLVNGNQVTTFTGQLPTPPQGPTPAPLPTPPPYLRNQPSYPQ